jgi:DMSO/TMAO reductase YedYZ heme-binding membrane subunit
MALRGWRLTLAIGAALLVMSGAVLAAAGTGEEGVRMLIRATARSTAVCFLLAFAARPVRQVWRTGLTKGLLRERRYVGVGAALSHFVHMLAIIWLAMGWPESYQPDVVTLVGGGLGFAFLYVMALTSTDAAVARLGRGRWQLLHRTGAWYVAFIFTISFVPDPGMGWSAIYAGFFGAFVAVAALRLAVYVRGRQRKAAPA